MAVSALFLTLVAVGQGGAAMALATTLSLVALGPHYAATYRRAYGSLAIVRAHPVVTLAAPFLLAAGAAAAVAWPATVGTAYFLAYVAWSGYHYSGQSLGVAMLYPLRQGARLTVREKRLMMLPLHASWLVSLAGVLRLQGAAPRNPAYQIVRDRVGGALARVLPALPTTAMVVAAGGVLLASLVGPFLVARARRRAGVPLPLASHGVIAAQVIWFGWGLFFPFFNIVLVPVFHALQYLALTGWHHQRGSGGGRGTFALYALTVAAIGLAINPGLLYLLVPGGAPERGLAVAAAVISFINLHHFLLDGRIWRLRERRVVQSMLA